MSLPSGGALPDCMQRRPGADKGPGFREMADAKPAAAPPACRGDLVQIETWFQEDGKLAAQRDFVISELGSGRVLGRATSTWVTINIAVGGAGWVGGWLAGWVGGAAGAWLAAAVWPPAACEGLLLHAACLLACLHIKLLLIDCCLGLPLPLPLRVQTRRLSKFPELMREKCDAFQLQPPRHAIPRECTRQKIPDLDMPAEVGGWSGRRAGGRVGGWGQRVGGALQAGGVRFAGMVGRLPRLTI